MSTLAVTHYEMFFRLSGEAHRAYEHRMETNESGGFYTALNMTMMRAVNYDRDTVMRTVREFRQTVEDNREGIPDHYADGYADGYIAGCDRAIYILQGGV